MHVKHKYPGYTIHPSSPQRTKQTGKKYLKHQSIRNPKPLNIYSCNYIG